MHPELVYPPGHTARVIRTVLFIDVVESVRLIEQHEDEAIRRWLGLVDHIGKDVVRPFDGRIVKSLGDGLLLEFEKVTDAIKAAFAIQALCARANEGLPAERRMLLRVGAHVGPLIADHHDVYGRGVNIAARLTTLAGPGEIVVSADVRDQMTPMLDGDVEDLGECILKHVEHPVRAYRVGPPGVRPLILPGGTSTPDLQPTLAVIPFNARSSDPQHALLGEVLADEIIGALSRTSELHVTSRLSTTVFRGRDTTLEEVSGHLHANYVLSGTFRVNNNVITLSAELADAKSSRIVWMRNLKGHVAGVLEGKDELIDRVVAEVSAAVVIHEIQRAQNQAMPTLETYTLLIAAVALLHRLSPQAFERAETLLQAVIERAPRQATPHAWMAKWYVMRVQQGWSADSRREGHAALECTRRALDLDPQCSLALTIDGLVNTNLLKRLDVAQERYETALRVNPNDSLAWLLKGTLHAFKGEGKKAVENTHRALRLSPLDPLRYYYDSLAATAELAAGNYERAIKLAESSLRANRTHTSTWRALAIARWQLGHTEAARHAVGELLRLEPSLTISGWQQRSPSSGFDTGRLWAEVMQKAGVPA